MSSEPQATPVALLITGEDAARRIAGLAAETFDGDEVAVALVDAGGGRWRVAIHFSSEPDRKALRALIAAAADSAAAKALRFERRRGGGLGARQPRRA